MSKSRIIELKTPVKVGDTTYTELKIGSFKTKHFKLLPDEAYEMGEDDSEQFSKPDQIKIGFKMLPLIASMANVSEEVIDELEYDDALNVLQEFGSFLGELFSAKTGSK